MFDKEKLKVVLGFLKHHSISDDVVCGLIWAAEDAEAQEILAAKRPSHGFYERLVRHMNEMGYDGYKAAEKFIANMNLNIESFRDWEEDSKFAAQLE